MIRIIVLMAFLAAACAFVAPQNKVSNTAIGLFGFKKGAKKSKQASKGKGKAASAAVFKSTAFAGGLVGSDVEVPNFDPFGLSAGRSDETLQWYRAAELKHSRICMLACLGLWTQPALHLPDDVFVSTRGYGALEKLSAERPEAVVQIVLALAAIEVFSLFKDGQGEGTGDLGFDPLNLKGFFKLQEGDNLEQMQLRELKNGRLAMIGTSAMLLQEAVTGFGPYEQLLHLPNTPAL